MSFFASQNAADAKKVCFLTFYKVAKVCEALFYLQDESGAKSMFSDVLQSRERSSHLVKKRSIVLDEMAFRMITCKILFWVIFHVKSIRKYVSGKKSSCIQLYST